MWGQKINPEIILRQNETVNLDDHAIVRGLLVSKMTISRIEDEVGGTLVPDHMSDLLNVLDEVAEYVRVGNNGKHTPQRTIEFHNGKYTHRDLIVSESVMSFQLGFELKIGDVAVGGVKKMWFRLPMNLQINRPKRSVLEP